MTEREVKLYRISTLLLRIAKFAFVFLSLFISGIFFYTNFIAGKPLKTINLQLTKEVVFLYENGKNIEIRIPKGSLVKATIYPDKLNLKINNSIEVELKGQWNLKELENYILIFQKEKEIEGEKLSK